ncbi:hypothetical protein [Virgibacillus sp. DJP39]|uniref:hypothetical protein n=1 Tax=Virgibacillus sp. DJP39 TaxID=3409790 RepID=UPI003BB5329C
MLKKKKFQLTLLLGLLSGGFLAGIIFIPAYVEQVLQVPVENAGYWLAPLALASGIGAGFGLAPLNVLVGESAKSGEQGSALGTLSLIRQIGLTLFPTIYAGYITGSLTKITSNIDSPSIKFDQQENINYGEIQSKIGGN